MEQPGVSGVDMQTRNKLAWILVYLTNARNEQRKGKSPEVVNYQGLGVAKPRKDLAYEIVEGRNIQRRGR